MVDRGQLHPVNEVLLEPQGYPRHLHTEQCVRRMLRRDVDGQDRTERVSDEEQSGADASLLGPVVDECRDHLVLSRRPNGFADESERRAVPWPVQRYGAVAMK